MGQVRFPTASVLKKNKVTNIVVRQHNLPNSYIDSTKMESNAQLDQLPFIWAKCWLNASGYPDSIHNYMQDVAYRKELFNYESKGQLKGIEVINHKNQSVTLEIASFGKNGQITYLAYSKGKLKAVKLTDKSHHVMLSNVYTDARIFGYDSLVYRHDFEADTSVETYYLNGVISHQLTKKWLGSGPDSFYQSFYQSNAEAGRMPSYHVMLPVARDGSLIVPDVMAFGDMFRVITYQNRFLLYNPFGEKIEKLFVEDTLIKQSETIEQKRTNTTIRHFYTFHYVFK
ncbi:MAG: hypothetical protein ACI8SE_000807 [Bacteroidia bacterium]